MSGTQRMSSGFSGVTAAVVRIFGAVALSLAVLLSAGASARAQVVCTAHADMAPQLEESHGEQRTAVAVTGSGNLLEVFSRPDGRTWSVVVTMTDGRTCLLLSGRDWHAAREVAEGPTV